MAPYGSESNVSPLPLANELQVVAAMIKPKSERDRAIEKLGELIEMIQIAMLTTVTEDGRLWSRPITTQHAKFDGDLWLLSRLDSPKAHEVRLNRHVSLCYVKPDENIYVSLSGTAQIVTDRAKAEESLGFELRGVAARRSRRSEPGADPRDRGKGGILGRS